MRNKYLWQLAGFIFQRRTKKEHFLSNEKDIAQRAMSLFC